MLYRMVLKKRKTESVDDEMRGNWKGRGKEQRERKENTHREKRESRD